MEEKGIVIPEDIDEQFVQGVLKKRIEDLNIDAAKRDVEAFIQDERVLDLWSHEFFESIISQIKYTP